MSSLATALDDLDKAALAVDPGYPTNAGPVAGIVSATKAFVGTPANTQTTVENATAALREHAAASPLRRALAFQAGRLAVNVDALGAPESAAPAFVKTILAMLQDGAAIVLDLRRRGFELSVEDDDIRVGPAALLSAQDRANIEASKVAIYYALTDAQTIGVPRASRLEPDGFFSPY